MNLQIFGIMLTITITIFFLMLTVFLSTYTSQNSSIPITSPEITSPNPESDVPQTAEIERMVKEIKPDFVPGQIIIKFKPEFVSSLDLQGTGTLEIPTTVDIFLNISEKYNISSITSIVPKPTNPAMIVFFEPLSNSFLVNFDERFEVKDMIKDFERLSIIDYVEPNFYYKLAAIPNDPNFGTNLWGLDNNGQITPDAALRCDDRNVIDYPGSGIIDADIDAVEFWDVNTGDNTFVVGVIDTGIDYTHPDLIDNIWINSEEIPNNNIDDDGNGYVDDYYGYDFSDNDSDPMDYQGHGTHVAGTIGAKGNNAIGITGVNWDVKLATLKIFPDSTSTTVVKAINYANMMGIKVTNNSWGGYIFSHLVRDAIRDANDNEQLFIAAAGNDETNNDEIPYYPSGYELQNIISVAATTHTDDLAWFSQYGPTTVDIGAPGADIFSTIPPDCIVLGSASGQSYFWNSGTSMAAPYVTGAVALIWSEFPTQDYLQIKYKLMGSVDELASLQDMVLSNGRLNLQNTLDSDAIPPSQISDLSYNMITDDSITLSWTASGDDGDVGTASFYDLRYSTNMITEVNFNNASPLNINKPNPAGITEEITIENIFHLTDYYFAIKTFDNVGNVSPISNILTVTTPDDLVSPSASDITVSDTGHTSITLTWNAPYDDEGDIFSGPSSHYSIKYDTEPILIFADADTWIQNMPDPQSPNSIETFTVRDLEPETKYYFIMRSQDNANNYSQLSYASAITNSSLLIFSDDVENGENGMIKYSNNLWHITERHADDEGHSSSHSWWYGQESTEDYDTGVYHAGVIGTQNIDLNSHTGAVVKMNYFLENDYNESDPDKDRAIISIFDDQYTFFAGIRHVFYFQTNGEFKTTGLLDVSDYDGNIIDVRMMFFTDNPYVGDDHFEGFYVDDIQVLVDGNSISCSLPTKIIEITSSGFNPSRIVIPLNTVIHWDNTSDSFSRSVTSGTSEGGPDNIFDSGVLSSGSSYEKRFEEAGEFPYFDMIHPWIAGTIIVKDYNC